MKYDIDKLHQPESGERRSGRTTRAIFDAIGKVMVTENETVIFVADRSEDFVFIRPMFCDIVINHFGMEPINGKHELGIKGYTSKIRMESSRKFELNQKFYGYDIIPTIDVRWGDDFKRHSQFDMY